MTSSTLTLHRGPLALALVPEVGGSVARFALERDGRTIELFRSMSAPAIAAGNPLFASCFPLIPLSNRIENGRYSFAGRSFEMAPNLPPHPHPLHGHGWLGRWTVRDRDAASATLDFEYEGDDWPSRYTATQRFTLGAEGLAVELELINAGTASMPAGIGLHPFFPRTSGTLLRAELGDVWLCREDKIPERRVTLPPAWDFRGGRPLDGLDLDHCFDGWNGRASIAWPDARLELALSADPAFSHAVIYAPPDKPFFCFEPVSHANLALNLAEQGVNGVGFKSLEPGETLRGAVRFAVRDLG